MMKSIEDNIPHEVSELMCLKCLHRWIGVYPSSLLLKEMECACGEVGYIIKTGQTIPDEVKCDSCSFWCNQQCRIGLQGVPKEFCDYYKKR